MSTPAAPPAPDERSTAVDVTVEGGVAAVVLDDPPLNILSRRLLARVRGTLAELAGDATLRVLVLSARGKHFSAGASVEEHLPGQVEEMIPEFIDTVAALEAFPVPVVAAVQGRCLGGALELVLAADIVLAAENALLGVPEIALGVFPPAACVQLPRLVPTGVAAELLFTGAPMTAQAAREAGLVSRTSPAEVLLTEAMTVAEAIAAHSAAALRETKKALRAGRDAPAHEAMREAARIYLEDLMATDDATEGLTAFVEKRQPQWRHA